MQAFRVWTVPRAGSALAAVLALVLCLSPATKAQPPSSAIRGPSQLTQPAQITSDVVDVAELFEDLRVLSADDMEGRQFTSAGNARARAYIVARFRDLDLTPIGADFEHPFRVRDALGFGRAAREGVNVIGLVDGARRPRRYIVVSAHYDHIGIRNGRVFNGANDNASGTAALFALAAYFRQYPPSNSILFVAFDGEEQGLLGSRAFVRSPPVDPSTLAINLNADMVGRDPDNRLFVVGTSRQPFLVPVIERVATRVPVTLLMGHDDPAGGSDWTADSDQYAFIEAGIPGLHFGVEDEAQHHRSTDDYETMTHGFYVQAVETLIEVVKEVDASLDAIGREAP